MLRFGVASPDCVHGLWCCRKTAVRGPVGSRGRTDSSSADRRCDRNGRSAPAQRTAKARTCAGLPPLLSVSPTSDYSAGSHRYPFVPIGVLLECVRDLENPGLGE